MYRVIYEDENKQAMVVNKMFPSKQAAQEYAQQNLQGKRVAIITNEEYKKLAQRARSTRTTGAGTRKPLYKPQFTRFKFARL